MVVMENGRPQSFGFVVVVGGIKHTKTKKQHAIIISISCPFSILNVDRAVNMPRGQQTRQKHVSALKVIRLQFAPPFVATHTFHNQNPKCLNHPREVSVCSRLAVN